MTRAPRRQRARRGLALALATMALGTTGCARLVARPSHGVTHDAAAIVAAGAAREQALDGLKLTLSVRATTGPAAARLASPAYLVIDDPEHLHLQVLSPFGPTVLDLKTNRDAFTLILPMQNQTRTGTIDLAALAAGTTPEDERMIMALALLFRPKMSRTSCRDAGPGAVRCAVGADLSVTTRVDDALRPVREDYAGPDGLLLTAVLEEYTGTGPNALPGRITIADGTSDGPALVIRVLKVRRGGSPAA